MVTGQLCSLVCFIISCAYTEIIRAQLDFDFVWL